MLFKIYPKKKYAKQIWDSFEENNGSEDLGTKKYKWIKFQMDGKPIVR